MNDNTLPPCAIEAEQSVLGGLLLDNRAYERIASELRPDDFYRSDHTTIYSTIAAMLDRGEPVDVVTVSEVLERSGRSDECGGLAYLGDLAANTPSAANILSYVKAVVDCKARRNMIEAGQRLVELAHAPDGDAVVRADKASSIVLALGEQRGSKEPVSVSVVMSSVLQTLQKRVDAGGAISGLSTGFVDLDKATTGLHTGNLVIVAGRPAMGKTTLSVNIAENIAIAGGVALVFSLEMSADDLVERSMARAGSVNTQNLREGKLTDDDWSRMTVALGKLNGKGLVIDDDPGTATVSQMRRKSIRVKRKHGALDLIVVDYLQLMRGEGGNRNEEIGGITRGLKLLARELSVPIILLSQLNRGVEERTDKRPMMSDLRESGAIEQDADVILMAYRDDYYNESSSFKGFAEIIIRKQRMGPTGTVPLVFQGQYSRFADADIGEFARARDSVSFQPMRKRKGGFDS
ncbi:MAG: replicative DNA helicase [Fluviibacter phosphoraccumulans]